MDDAVVPAMPEVARRVDEILDVVYAMASMDFTRRAKVRGRGSLDALAAGVNMLAEELQAATTELQQANEELERRVAARTAELAQANQNLRLEMQQREQLQARLAASDRMIAAGTLAAGVGHEINNPLAFVMANADFASAEIEQWIAGLDTAASTTHRERLEEVRRAIGESREGLARIQEIVRGLKTYAREPDPTSQSTDVRPVIETSLRMAMNDLRHRARVAIDIQGDLQVRGCATQIGQVMLNVLINAGQAIREGSAHENEITLRAHRFDDRVLIEVEDTGCGIPQENLPRVFDPFFTTKPVGQGTGLGLWICHNLVRNLGGDIQIRSEIGRGTTVRVELPVAPPSSPPAHVVGTPDVASGASILVIDDEEMIGRVVKRSLREHTVSFETSGRAALDRLCKGEAFDVILSDLMLPDLTGMALHAELARQRPTLLARMVFMSGGAFTTAARKFLESTTCPTLEKPLDFKRLREVVRAIAAGRPVDPH